MNFVIDVALKATLLLALGHLVIVAGRRLSAGNRHIIAAAFLLATALLPVLSLTMPKRTLELLPAQTPLADRLTSAATTFLTTDVVPIVLPTTSPGEPYEMAGSQNWGGDVVVGDINVTADTLEPRQPNGTDTLTIAKTPAVQESSLNPAPSLPAFFRWENLGWMLFLGWLAGALFVAGRLVVGIARVVWIRARATGAPAGVEQLVASVAARFDAPTPEVLVSDRADVPFVCGIVRAAIIMPRHSLGWDRARLKAVITHEMAHVKRRDCYTLMLGRLTVALHWFNPLAWGLEKESRRLCERACDDVVLSYGEAPSDYASHILEIARGLPDHDDLTSVALAVSRKSEIEGRLMAILHPSIGRQVVSARSALAVCAAVLVIAMAAATFTLGAAPVDQLDAVDALQPDTMITVTPEGTNSNTSVNSSSDESDEWDEWDESDPNRYGAFSKKERQKNGSNHYNIAWDFHRNHNYEKAAENFVQAAVWGYRPGTAMYNAACGYAMSGQQGRSIRALERAVAEGWDDASHMRGDDDLRSIRDTSAFAALIKRIEEACEEAHRHDGKDDHEGRDAGTSPHDDRYGLSSEIQSKLELVMSEMESAGRSVSVGVDDLNEIAYRLMNRGEYEDGLPILNEAIRKSDQRSTRALYNMACVQAIQGHTDEALSWLEKAIDQGLDRVDLLNEDSDLDSIRDDRRFIALVANAEALSLSSVGGHGWGKDDRGGAWRQAGDSWGRYLRSHPRSGRAWSNLGFAHFKLQEFEKAEKAFQRAYQFDYQPGATAYNIASTYARRSDNDEAFHWLDKAARAGFDVESRLFNDDDVRSLRRDPRAEKFAGRYRDLAEKSEKEAARSYRVSWGANGTVNVRGDAGAWAVASGTTQRPEVLSAIEAKSARGNAVVAGSTIATVNGGSGGSYAVLAHPPTPPSPPQPPLPPVLSVRPQKWSVEGLVLVRGKSMIVNTYDDYNLSANRSGKTTRVNVNGKKYTFETDHLLVYPINGQMYVTEDRDTVGEALDIIDVRSTGGSLEDPREEVRDIDREISKLKRKYESLTRKHEQMVRKMERVRKDEDRDEIRSDIEELIDDQNDILHEIDEQMEEREALVERAAEHLEELVEEREARIERLAELMEDAIEQGKARPIR